MIGIDTNVLVRYLAQDDRHQAVIASNFIENVCSEDNPGFVNLITLCELIWVLKRHYIISPDQITRIMEQLLRTSQLVIQNPQVAWLAIEAFHTSNADFADCIIAQVNRANHCSSTVTLDVDAFKTEGFQLLK